MGDNMKKMKMFFRAAALFLTASVLSVSLLACNQPASDKPAGTTPKKRVAFTFDDGPTPGVTDLILDKLEAIGGKATFFQVANRHNYVDDAVYDRINALGCEVGSHTWSHPSDFYGMGAAKTDEQLRKSVEAIEAETGKKVTLFRPVGGAADGYQIDNVAQYGMHTIHWSLDTEDWREQTNDLDKAESFINNTVAYIVENVEDGDIILMHELYKSSYEIFSRAADKLAEMGYEFVTVSELLELDENSVPLIKMHHSGKPLFDPDAVG